MMTRRVIAIACAIGLLAVASPAGAQSASETKAHDAFVLGQAAFNEGRYDDALTQFQAAYDLSKRPELLLTLAKTYRKLGRYDDALAACDRYLATNPAQPQQRSTYEFMGQLHAEKTRVESIVNPKNPVTATGTAPATTDATATTTNALVTAPPPRDDDAGRRKRIIYIAAAAGVVVLAVGLGVGLGVGLSHSDRFPSSGLGTVGFSH
jgi:tetratricopeptide (TPR) repeat protein